MMIIVTIVSRRMETGKGLEVSSCKQLKLSTKLYGTRIHVVVDVKMVQTKALLKSIR
jgi:hypothetical protein